MSSFINHSSLLRFVVHASLALWLVGRPKPSGLRAGPWVRLNLLRSSLYICSIYFSYLNMAREPTLRGKSLLHPQLWGMDYFTPQLWNRLFYSLNFSKPVKLPPSGFGQWFCYNKDGLLQWQWFCLFYLFISAESLKNHSKSQKNHKIENLILLDSTWVDLHSKHIIWYTLIQSFCYRFWSIVFYN
jgi:hypothetical protein